MESDPEEQKRFWDRVVRIWFIDSRAMAFLATLILVLIVLILHFVFGVDMSWLLEKK